MDRLTDRYFREIKRLPRVSREEEHVLADLASSGDSSARHRLVEANLSFVAKIAHEYRNMGLPLADLLSEGNIGLIEAARRFDPARGTKFISYAVWWVRKYMMDAATYQTRTIRVPRTRLRKLYREIDLHPKGSDRLPLHPISLDATPDEEPGLTIGEKLTDEADWDTDERLILEESKTLMLNSLRHLSKDERFVLERRFGLDDEPCQTLQQIGDQLCVSREWIRRLEKKAMLRLRNLLAHQNRRPVRVPAAPPGRCESYPCRRQNRDSLPGSQ